MINILIDKSGKTSKENIFLGNQHENLDETLHFLFPQEYKDYYKYITYSYSNNNQRVTGISPLVDDNFIVSSKITKCAGVWELNLICKTSPVDLNDKVIDLTENNSTKEHIFISNTIYACVSGNSIDVESFNNIAVDENIANLYDSILALKNRVEENDKAHEQNEEIRKANELERQEAENTRKANESERVSAEQLRVEAETERASAETARTSAESVRELAEQSRISAESQRVTAEATRESAENARVEAENARENAEQLRVTAETARQEAESKREGVINDLRNSVDQKITKFYATNNGDTHIVDSDNGRIEDMMIYGKSSQDGTPTVENPIDIKSVVNPTIKVCGKNLLQSNLSHKDKQKINIEKGTILTLIHKNGPSLKGGNLRFTTVDGSIIWFGFNQGKVKEQITIRNDVILLEYLFTSEKSENYALYIGDENTYEPYKGQTITLPITLNAIPVSSGGNVTIDGQQYIADYVDVERGKLVRMCGRNAFNTKDGYADEEYRLMFDLSTDGKQGDSECLYSTFKWTAWTTCVMGSKVYVKNIQKPNDEFYTAQELKELSLDFDVVYQLAEKQETDLTTEHAQALKELVTYYPTTNISTNSEQLEGYTVFNYPISLANGWNYVKQQLNDNRDYIYDMDLQSAEAYVNSEYAVALTELGV